MRKINLLIILLLLCLPIIGCSDDDSLYADDSIYIDENFIYEFPDIFDNSASSTLIPSSNNLESKTTENVITVNSEAEESDLYAFSVHETDIEEVDGQEDVVEETDTTDSTNETTDDVSKTISAEEESTDNSVDEPIVEIETDSETESQNEKAEQEIIETSEESNSIIESSTTHVIDEPSGIQESNNIITESDAIVSNNEETEESNNIVVYDNEDEEQNENEVWIPKSGKKYHKKKECSNMKSPKKVTKDEAIDKGYEPCKRCYK